MSEQIETTKLTTPEDARSLPERLLEIAERLGHTKAIPALKQEIQDLYKSNGDCKFVDLRCYVDGKRPMTVEELEIWFFKNECRYVEYTDLDIFKWPDHIAIAGNTEMFLENMKMFSLKTISAQFIQLFSSYFDKKISVISLLPFSEAVYEYLHLDNTDQVIATAEAVNKINIAFDEFVITLQNKPLLESEKQKLVLEFNIVYLNILKILNKRMIMQSVSFVPVNFN